MYPVIKSPKSPRPIRRTLLVIVVLSLTVIGAVYGLLHFVPSAHLTQQATPTVPAPTQTANAIQTVFAGGSIPQATLTIPSTPVPGATPQWRTVAHLYNTQPGNGPSGQFVVLAGAKARIQWTCTVATNDPSATLGCSAALYNAKTGERISALVDTNTNTNGLFLIPISSIAVVYELHIATDNQAFSAYYQVFQ